MFHQLSFMLLFQHRLWTGLAPFHPSVCLLRLPMATYRITDSCGSDSEPRSTHPQSLLSKQTYFRQNNAETSLLNKRMFAYKSVSSTQALISIWRTAVLSADEADAVPHGFSRLIINVSVVFSLAGAKHAICANEETRDRR